MFSFNELLMGRKLQKGQEYNMSPASVVNNSMVVNGADSVTSSAASLTHKEAERRRRQRINTHLTTLRTLLPSIARTDKASLLAEVVQHVKDLKRRVDELNVADDTSCFPGESDEASVTVGYYYGQQGLLKATLCCQDRPGLNRDLVQAIRSAQVRAVKAEMVTVGGRTKSVVVLKWSGGGGGEEELKALKVALKAVAENRISGPRVGFVSGKRARVYGSVFEG